MAATIKPIDGRSVHQIQSGQVIVDLCSVVKELVENSVDAGATSIDVRFRNQGLDLIEVQDNGSGISPANYASVALKHHTSKLSSYSDISSLQTFGFRGEALASVCALSTLSVTTCLQADEPKGSRLSFESSGQLNGTAVVAAQRGTTVSVEALFHNLPVRRRELERNIKREWHKVIALLTQYACIQTNLKFSVSQQPIKGKRIILFSTKGNSTTRDNIINIFGAKTMSVLVSVDLDLEMQPSTAGPSLDPRPPTSSNKVRVVGHVSRPSPGDGRQTPDRQMFFVNGRPCGLPQFAKTFNEVYRSYNYLQSPFILADIRLNTHMYDVNVSPDKRSILLHDQSRLLDSLRASLSALFDAHDHSVPVSQLLNDKQGSNHNEIASRLKPALSTSHRLRSKRVATVDPQFEADSAAQYSDDPESSSSGESSRLDVGRVDNRSRRRSGHNQNPINQYLSKEPGAVSQPVSSVSDIHKELPEFLKSESQISKRCHVASEGDEPGLLKPVRDFNKRLAEHNMATAIATRPVSHGKTSGSNVASDIDEAVAISDETTTDDDNSLAKRRRVPGGNPELKGASLSPQNLGSHSPSGRDEDDPSVAHTSKVGGPISVEFSHDLWPSKAGKRHSLDGMSSSAGSHLRTGLGPQDPVAKLTDSDIEGIEDANTSRNMSVPRRAMPTGAGSRRSHISLQVMQRLRTDEESIRSQMNYLRLRRSVEYVAASAVDQVEDIGASDAESKLPLVITRSDFSKMRVVGQFNMGFIIAVRPAAPEAVVSERAKHDELFIIDQHASDEKYNFERLQDTTTVQSQRLVHPRKLQLTVLEEEIVMENQAAIEANGFKVVVDAMGDSPVGSRCQVLALPLSRETTFSLEDLEELISLLGDEPCDSHHVPRPSKVRKMFAMRACRSSIMIGKALTGNQMYTLLRQMGEIDRPWNCPHGRPTMRHLCRLETWDGRRWKGDATAGTSSVWRAYGSGDQGVPADRPTGRADGAGPRVLFDKQYTTAG